MCRGKMILTTVMFLKPVSTRFFNSSHPIPPAPTTRSLASVTFVPCSGSNTGFAIFLQIR